MHDLMRATLALALVVVLGGAASAAGNGGASWRTFVDAEEGFAIEVPEGHHVSRNDGAWYIHGWHQGEPMVPDMAIYYDGVADVETTIAENYPEDAEVARLPFGRGTEGIRVTAEYENRLGDPYRASTYFVPADEGHYVIQGWEDLYWEPYDEVAMTFRFVEIVGDGYGQGR